MRKEILMLITLSSCVLYEPLYARQSAIEPIYSKYHHNAFNDSKRFKHQMLQQLILSSDQKDKINALQQKSFSFLQKSHKAELQVREKIMELALQPKINKASLNVLLKQSHIISEKMLRHKIFLRHQIYNILSKKQQTKLKTLMKQRSKQKS